MHIPGSYRAKKFLKNLRLLQLNKQIDPYRNVLLFSDPRGGSTWLTEILLPYFSNIAVLWEPLNITDVKPFRDLNFSWRQYIPEDEDWPAAKAAFNKVFQGKVLNYWTTQTSKVQQLQAADRLFVKFCRGNALLPWLVKQFDFEYKPIYLIRHPFAVVASQLKQGGWDYNFDGFVFEKHPYNEQILEHKDFLETLELKEEALIATWCLTNQVPLLHSQNNKDWITINYEQVVLQPFETLARIFKAWNIEDRVDLDELKVRLEKPSATTVKGSAIKGNKQIEQWQNRLSEEQITRMGKVLDYFNVKVYSTDPYPKIIFK